MADAGGRAAAKDTPTRQRAGRSDSPRRNGPARLAVAAVIASLAVLGLSACTTGPTDDDRAAWLAWADDTSAAGDAGAVSGPASNDAPTEGTTQTFDAPTVVASVELACIGTDSMSFTLTFTGTDSSVTEREDIVCRNGAYRTPVATPDSVGELTAFGANASSPDGAGYWVAALQQ